MLSFYQFLESQEKTEEQPQVTQIRQRSIPVGGFGGWKIHLRTGLDDKKREKAYKLVLKIIENSGNKWQSKILGGGEPDEKDITIYCGPKEEVNRAARYIKNMPELYDKLLPPEPDSDVSKGNIEILPKIYARFSASILNTAPYTFSQYGCKGWSMLDSEMRNSGQALMGMRIFDKEQACKKSELVLTRLFGKDFTG
jgi:hypothetical protein